MIITAILLTDIEFFVLIIYSFVMTIVAAHYFCTYLMLVFIRNCDLSKMLGLCQQVDALEIELYGEGYHTLGEPETIETPLDLNAKPLIEDPKSTGVYHFEPPDYNILKEKSKKIKILKA